MEYKKFDIARSAEETLEYVLGDKFIYTETGYNNNVSKIMHESGLLGVLIDSSETPEQLWSHLYGIALKLMQTITTTPTQNNETQSQITAIRFMNVIIASLAADDSQPLRICYEWLVCCAWRNLTTMIEMMTAESTPELSQIRFLTEHRFIYTLTSVLQSGAHSVASDWLCMYRQIVTVSAQFLRDLFDIVALEVEAVEYIGSISDLLATVLSKNWNDTCCEDDRLVIIIREGLAIVSNITCRASVRRSLIKLTGALARLTRRGIAPCVVQFKLSDWVFQWIVYECLGKGEMLELSCLRTLVTFGGPMTVARLEILQTVMQFPLRASALREHMELVADLLDSCHIVNLAGISDEDYLTQLRLGEACFTKVVSFVNTSLLDIDDTDSRLCIYALRVIHHLLVYLINHHEQEFNVCVDVAPTLAADLLWELVENITSFIDNVQENIDYCDPDSERLTALCSNCRMLLALPVFEPVQSS